jgi:predicted Zn-dependent protease
LEFFNRALDIDNRWNYLNLRLGSLYEKLGMYDKALAAYEKEKELRPDSSELKMVLGRTLIRLRRYQDAFSQLDQVPAQEQSGAYFYLLGWTLDRQGVKHGAEQFYALAQQLEGSLEAAKRAAEAMTGEG